MAFLVLASCMRTVLTAEIRWASSLSISMLFERFPSSQTFAYYIENCWVSGLFPSPLWGTSVFCVLN